MILLLGDSISVSSWSLGGKIAGAMNAAGYQVIVDAKGGRSALSFLRNEAGLARIADYKARGVNTVIYFLGTNDTANSVVGNGQMYPANYRAASQLISELERFATVIYFGALAFHAQSKYGPAWHQMSVKYRQDLSVAHPAMKVAPLIEWSFNYATPGVYRDKDGTHPNSKGRDAIIMPAIMWLTGKAPVNRMTQWAPLIDRAVVAYPNVPRAVVYSTMEHESGGQQKAKSNVGAIGLMQMMPAVAAQYVSPSGADPWEPSNNIMGGVRLLSDLMSFWSGSNKRGYKAADFSYLLAYTFASYYAGKGAVQKTYPAVPDGRSKTWAPQGEIKAYVTRGFLLYNKWVQLLGG